MTKNLNMTTGHPGRLLFSFALPLMFGNIFQQLYTVVDTAIVGRGVGMDALAALGCVDWLNWMFLGIVQGFSQGFSVRMAQKFGEGDTEGLKKTVGVSARLAMILALITLAVAQLGLPLFLKLLQVPGELKDIAMLYSRIILAGIPAMMYFNICASTLRAVGDSKTPLIAMAVASVTNIVLDCIAVFVLDWGVAGAAGATVFSQCVSGTICAVKIAKSKQLRFTQEHVRADSVLERRLLGLGTPIAMQNIIISAGGMTIQAVVNGFSKSFIAGFTATNKLYGVLEIAAISYGYAVTTYTGQNYGAQLWERIRKGVRWAVIICLGTSLVIAGIMVIFGRQITGIFLASESQELVAAAGNTAYLYLCAMSGALPMLYLLYVYRNALQGMGNTMIPLLSGVVELGIRVGGAAVIAFTMWQNGIFIAEVGSWIGAMVLLCISYYYYAAKMGK